MLKLLIVEDERWEREGLRDLFDWAAMGIGEVDTACDGIEGLDKALNMYPDIVVTDIQMPGMDGIEMSKRIREQLPDVRIVVLTGYDDFGYAREAILFRAMDYVLKPIEEDELQQTIIKVVKECELDLAKRRNEERLLQAEERMAAGHLITDLLKGKLKPEMITASMEDKIKELQGDCYAVIVIARMNGASEEQIGRMLDRPCMIQICDDFEDAWTVIVPMTQPITGALEMIVQPLMQQHEGSTGTRMVIGVGSIVPDLMQSDESYRQALSAVRFGLFHGKSGIVSGMEEEQAKQAFAAHAGEFARRCQELTKQIRLQTIALDADRVGVLLDELFECFGEHPGAGKHYILSLLNSLIGEVSLLGGKQEEGADVGDHVVIQPQQLLSLESLEEIRSEVKRFFATFQTVLDDKKRNKDEYVVNKVLRLIDKQYGSTSISLTSLAEEVFLSPNHLGMIFKKATGKTINEYMMEYRINKAEELLRTSKQKVAAIAAQVGIPSTSYFCSLFKQTYGMTPGQYQEYMQRQ